MAVVVINEAKPAAIRVFFMVLLPGDDLPAPTPSIAAGFAEMWPALRRQILNQDYFLKRALPPTAKPYREDFHAYVPGMTPPAAAE
jgi:hypothetical protein